MWTLISKIMPGKFYHSTSKYLARLLKYTSNLKLSVLTFILGITTCEQMKDYCVYIVGIHSHLSGPSVMMILMVQLDMSKFTWDLPSSDPAPSRIILRPPSSDGIYTVGEGANFVLTCGVDRYSYPRPLRGSQFSVLRVNASGTIQIGGNCYSMFIW